MKKAIPTLNVRLLNRVKRQILKEPKQFVMDKYFDRADYFRGDDTPKTIPNCGTAACIAGWTVAIEGGLTPNEAAHKDGQYRTYISERAERKLGIRGFGSLLFSAEMWPEPYRERWQKLTRLRQWKRRAKVAAARIDHFIKTGE